MDLNDEKLSNSITITIFCMDGVTFPIELELESTVSTLKTKISATRNILTCTMNLFIYGDESLLIDTMELMESINIFMLLKNFEEKMVLELLYDKCNGVEWGYSTNWKTDTVIQYWYGIRTNSDYKIIYLNLCHNILTGEIPPELGLLSNLTELNLYTNNLIGEIPPELGQLKNLTLLCLCENDLIGKIPPKLGQLTNLTCLDLYNNNLTGEIPPELGLLSNLIKLVLYHNNLTGEIPPELGLLSNLYCLELHNNKLTGEIPYFTNYK